MIIKFIGIMGVILWCIGWFYLVYYSIKKLEVVVVMGLIWILSVTLLLKAVSNESEKRGAYKQLRGEYTLVYHVDDQGNICDTVIVEVE